MECGASRLLVSHLQYAQLIFQTKTNQPNNNMKKIAVILLGLMASFSSVRAALDFSDTFNYADGSIVNNSGGVWVQNTGTAGSCLVSNQVLLINTARTEDIVHRLSTVYATNGAVTALYTSFLFRCTNGFPTVAGTGLPTAAGTYPVNLSASLSSYGGSPSVSGSSVVTIRILAAYPAPDAVPLIVSSATASGIVGSSFGYTTSATGSPTSFTASGLPPGLSVSATSGAISGTPTFAGLFPVTLTATNVIGPASATVVIRSAVSCSSVRACGGTGWKMNHAQPLQRS